MTTQPSGPLTVEELEAAFNTLYRGLSEAKQLFEAGRAGGRDGVVHALETVVKFLGLFDAVKADALHTPLGRLFDDLMSLDNGNVSVLLTPSARLGRSRASGFYDGLKGLAVFTVRGLESTGMQPDEARKMVASKLTKLRVRAARKGTDGGTGQITERTLRGWQTGIAADVGCHSIAAQTLRGLELEHLTEVTGMGLATLPTGSTPDKLLLSRFPAIDLRRAYIDKLASYVARTRSQETT